MDATYYKVTDCDSDSDSEVVYYECGGEMSKLEKSEFRPVLVNSL